MRRTRIRNPRLDRFRDAVRHYTSYEEERLLEKAGNLAGRILAINKVLAEEGRPILLTPTRDALLLMYEAYTPARRRVALGRKHAQGEGAADDHREDEVPGVDEAEQAVHLDLRAEQAGGPDASRPGPDEPRLRQGGGQAVGRAEEGTR